MSEPPDKNIDNDQDSDKSPAKHEKVAESIGVFIQGGGVAHFRDVILNIVSPNKADPSVARKQRLIYGAGFLVLTVTIGCLGWLSVNKANQKQAEENLILSRAISDKADPKLLPVAQRLILQADELASRKEYEKAIGHYRKVIDYSMILYQQDTNQAELTLLPSCSDNQSKYLESHEIFCEAQNKLVLLIENVYFPTLREQLKYGRVGKIDGDQGKDFREIFSEGALRTTYGLLVREDGIWADEGDDDGFVNSRQEALKLPCSLLSSIEKFWHDYLSPSCGWFDPETNSIYLSPNCPQLDGYTLTDSIFLSDYQPVIDHLKECSIVPLDVTESN